MRSVALIAVVVGAGAWLPAAATADDLDDLDALHGRATVWIDHPEATTAPDDAPPPARILYLNDCKPDGCLITTGPFDDSRIDRTSIPRHGGMLAPYRGSAAAWDATVACVRANYAPFTIRVVTTDPGDVPHFEAYAAGLPSELGFPGPLNGVASISCGVIPNAMSFSFLNLDPEDVQEACWTISQETAHNFGLAHSMLAADVMTYLSIPSRKSFVDQAACIGTQGCCLPHRECQCGDVEQNSHQRLLAIFGAIGATPPDIVIDEPARGASVLPGFAVRATVTDWNGVEQVELIIDGVAVARRLAPPYQLSAPTDLGPGLHTVTIRAADTDGFTADASVVVAVDRACTDDLSCAVAGPDRVCVEGRCVPPTVSPAAGCAAGGSSPLSLGAALLVAALLPRRRRGG